MITGLLVVAIFAAIFSMIAKRVSSTIVTAPMVFLAFGFIMSDVSLMPSATAEHMLHLVAEIALVLLLFLDAAQTDFNALRKRHVWPLRMLLIGLPLAVIIGTIANLLFLPEWPLVALALLAAIFAPTDAALGQAVVTNEAVPVRVRRALTVESGLNDGLALPIILLFASLTANVMDKGSTDWILFGAEQLVLGPLVGVVVGTLGARMLLFAKDRDLTADAYEGVGAIAMAGMAYLGASEVGGNGFISTFVAGLCFGSIVKGRCKFVYEFTEGQGFLLTWGAFFLLGLVLLPEAIANLTWAVFGLILVSLFVVRPLAIWISLLGTDASTPTRLFFGWFGPRGLATALFALLIIPQIDHELADAVLAIAINGVWISAVLHGVSANPGARWYARLIEKSGDCAETMPVEMSARPLPNFKS